MYVTGKGRGLTRTRPLLHSWPRARGRRELRGAPPLTLSPASHAHTALCSWLSTAACVGRAAVPPAHGPTLLTSCTPTVCAGRMEHIHTHRGVCSWRASGTTATVRPHAVHAPLPRNLQHIVFCCRFAVDADPVYLHRP